MTTPTHPKTGIVLFAHGSRDPAWRAPIEAVAQRMRELSAEAQVQCAYLEWTQPDLATTVAQLLADGVRHITVWPMFLGTGRHAREDLPVLLQQLREQHPGIEFVLKPAIAEHPQVLTIMALAALGAAPEHTAAP